jgi:hypothetical protein
MPKPRQRKTVRADWKIVALVVAGMAIFLAGLFLTGAAGKIAQPKGWIRR